MKILEDYFIPVREHDLINKTIKKFGHKRLLENMDNDKIQIFIKNNIQDMDAYGDMYSNRKTYLTDDGYSNDYIKETIESMDMKKYLKIWI